MKVRDLRKKLKEYPYDAEVRILKNDEIVDLTISFTSESEEKEDADYVVFSNVDFDLK